jgi:hypothetical protein
VISKQNAKECLEWLKRPLSRLMTETGITSDNNINACNLWWLESLPFCQSGAGKKHEQLLSTCPEVGEIDLLEFNHIRI